MERPQALKMFIHAVSAKFNEGNLLELCEKFGISENEMNECLNYLRANEGMNIKDL